MLIFDLAVDRREPTWLGPFASIRLDISDRGHLPSVTIERIRAHIRDQGLDEKALIQEGELIVPDDPSILLKLLNEDLFKGGLTDVAFVSDNKAPRT
jgi:hypothetical protein